MKMSEQAKPRMGELVTLDDATKERLRRQMLIRKADDRIPDEVWMILQECGEHAARHLQNILESPSFSKRKIHEQIRVIELALMRAYGAHEGSIKRPPRDPEGGTDPRQLERGDAIKRLASQARLPELGMRRKVPMPEDQKD